MGDQLEMTNLRINRTEPMWYSSRKYYKYERLYYWSKKYPSPLYSLRIRSWWLDIFRNTPSKTYEVRQFLWANADWLQTIKSVRQPQREEFQENIFSLINIRHFFPWNSFLTLGSILEGRKERCLKYSGGGCLLYKVEVSKFEAYNKKP